MNEEQMQPSNPQMNPDEAAASLAFATYLQEQMTKEDNPLEAPQDAQDASGQEIEQEVEKDEPLDKEALKEEIMKDVKDAIKEEMDGIRQDIKSALSENEEE